MKEGEVETEGKMTNDEREKVSRKSLVGPKEKSSVSGSGLSPPCRETWKSNRNSSSTEEITTDVQQKQDVRDFTIRNECFCCGKEELLRVKVLRRGSSCFCQCCKREEETAAVCFSEMGGIQ